MSLRRISIHADVAGERRSFDVAVCALSPVAELLPALIDMIGAEPGHPWRLHRVTGEALEESLSLTDSGVWDGDVVTLTAPGAAPRGLLAVSPIRSVAEGGEVRRIGRRTVIEICWAWLVLAAAVALTWAGLRTSSFGAALVAASCAAATSWRAVVTDSAALAVVGALSAGAVGVVVVPAGSVAAHALLGSAVVVALSVVLAALVPSAAVALTATGCTALPIAVSAAVTTVWSLPAGTAGTLLTVGGIGLLAAAPRCAITLTGGDLAQRAAEAHDVLSGLVAGSAAAAAAGTGIIACTSPGWSGIAFITATAALLLLRVRGHVDAVRCLALAVAGLSAVTSGLVAIAAAHPGWPTWAAVGVAAAVGWFASARPSPSLRRAVDGLDHLCTAVLIPLACWTVGLYAAARNWVLT